MSARGTNGGDGETRDRAYALAALALTGARRDACPPLEDLQRWHEQSLDAAQARAMQDHVAACDRCFELWRGLVALGGNDPRHRRRESSTLARLWEPVAALTRSRAVLAGAAAGVAMLAVIGVYLATVPFGPHAPPLPGYELELQGRALFRGAVEPPLDAPVEFEPGTRFELVLRPERAVSEDVAARTWIQHEGETRALDAPPELVARGVVVFAGEIGRDWVLPSGDSRLIVVVGRSDALPEVATLTERLRDETRAAGDDWTAWSVSVRVVDETSGRE